MLEREIEKAVCKYAESKGFTQYKFSSPAHAGVPDRLFLGPHGRVFFIEFKAKGKKPTPLQDRECARIVANGIDCYWVDNVDDGKKIVDGQHAVVLFLMTITGELGDGGDEVKH